MSLMLMQGKTAFQTIIFCACIVVLFFSTSLTYSHELAPGNLVALHGTSSGQSPELVGEVLEDRLIPFQVTNSFSLPGYTRDVVFRGALQDRVVRSAETDNLIFSQRIRDIQDSSGTLAFVRRANFSGSRADVEFRQDGAGTIGPYCAFRSATGDFVQFVFSGSGEAPDNAVCPSRSGSPDLSPQSESRFYEISTDANKYDLSGTTIIDVEIPIVIGFGSIGTAPNINFLWPATVVIPTFAPKSN